MADEIKGKTSDKIETEPEVKITTTETQAGLTPQTTPQATPQAPPEKVGKLMQKLVLISTKFVVKLATCRCKDRLKCPLYRVGQEIADVVDELQDVMPTKPK